MTELRETPWRGFCLRAALATGLLVLVELVWMGINGVQFTAGRWMSLVSVLAALVAVAALLGLLGSELARRLWPSRPALVWVALAAAPAWFSARELFTGAWIRTVPGAPLMALGAAAALSALAGLAAHWASGAGPSWLVGSRSASLAAAVALLGGASWADNRLLVGHYPPFHFVLAAGMVFAAQRSAALLLPSISSPRSALVARVAAWAWVAAALAAPVLGSGPSADALVTYTHGLLPKARQAAVKLLSLRAGAAGVEGSQAAEPLSVATALAREFRLRPSDDEQSAALRASTRNVIVVLMDALREDHVGPRPDGTTLTPRLDELAAHGVRFTSAYSPSDHTGRSVPCIATSYPLDVTIKAADWGVPLKTWIEHLDEAGLLTFNNGSDYIFRKYGHIPIATGFGASSSGLAESKSDELAEDVLAFVAECGERPFAAYTHWSYAHVGRTKDMPGDYAAMVRRCDEELGQLVDGLRQAGVWEQTLLAVTSDHGYALGEGAKYLGAQGCGEISLRVPLIVHLPRSPLRGRTVSEPVSNLALASTLLDVLAPKSDALVGEPSLWPLMAGRPLAETGARRGVYSSTGYSRMLRLGAHKFTENLSLSTQVAFDLGADPEERQPLRDEAVLANLRQALDDELARMSRLAQALVAGHDDQLDPLVLKAFAAGRLEASDVAPFVAKLWELDGPTRRFLLEEIYRRRIAGLADALDAVAPQSQGDDEELLLALRIWSGSTSASAEAVGRYPDLSVTARLLLAAMLPDMSRDAVRPIQGLLERDMLASWELAPDLTKPEGRLAALLVYGLTKHLAKGQLDAVKDVAVEAFNAWPMDERSDPGFPSLRDRKFSRRWLLDVFSNKPEPADLARAEKLLRTREFAERVPTMVRRLDTPEAREWLLDVFRRWEGVAEDPPGKFLTSAVPGLAEFEDEEFRRRADALLQERFPQLARVP